ncbi:hypothetical protein NDU88_006010 [Pleurodeles waltl]|uniref:Uncharacterized protein n=1 Tax=Pleurodeles waltl TaxID=8319 RepID=A0AAV7MB11_PLEWA|nr:hypothetical protein NDU88_006010 [Pleurodeles waltl]
MTSQRHTKKEGTLKDIFSKAPAKKVDLHKEKTAALGTSEQRVALEGDNAPITLSFFEQIFGVLRDDIATLKQEIVMEVKDLKKDVNDMGQQVDSLKKTHDACEEELASWMQGPCTARQKTGDTVSSEGFGETILVLQYLY